VRWMRDPRAVDPVIKATEDSDPVVRARALGALMRLVNRFFPDQRTAAVFVRHLDDEQPLKRFNAISGIGCLRQESLLTHLVRPLEQGTDQDRAQAAAQIRGLSFETQYHMNQLLIEWSESGRNFWREKMLEALSDPAPKVREHATRALENLGDTKSIPVLQRARDKEADADVRVYMEESLKVLLARA
jgi:HEAT repeat protein